MAIQILLLILGLTLILFGANWLVDGSTSIARKTGMSEFVIGLTIVGIGTSTPEMVVSFIAAFQGQSELALGNVIGSNIFNILMIIGVTAMVRPIHVSPSIMVQQMPLMVLAALLMLLYGVSGTLNGTGTNQIWRTDGIVLLLLATLFMIYTVKVATSCDTKLPKPDVIEEELKKPAVEKSLLRSILYIIIGLAGLVWGGDKFVDSAKSLALMMGVSEAVVGLTIVAMGTSLPELATSVVAAVKGRSDMAVGNIIGSNIFNVTLVLGAAAAIRPLQFGSIGIVDLLVLTAASLAFWIMGRVWGRQVINRAEGAILVLAYAGYTAWLISQAS